MPTCSDTFDRSSCKGFFLRHRTQSVDFSSIKEARRSVLHKLLYCSNFSSLTLYLHASSVHMPMDRHRTLGQLLVICHAMLRSSHCLLLEVVSAAVGAALGTRPMEHPVGTRSEVAHVRFADAVEFGQRCTCALDSRVETVAELGVFISRQAWEREAVFHAPLQVDDPAAHPQERLQGQHPLDQDCSLTLISFQSHKIQMGLL